MCIKKHVIHYFDDQKSNQSHLFQSLLTFEVLGDAIVVRSKREGREFMASVPLESTSVVCTHEGVSLIHRNQSGLQDEKIKIPFNEIGLSLGNSWFPNHGNIHSFGIVEWVYKAQKHRNSLPVVFMRYLTGHSQRPRSMGSAFLRLGGLVLLGFFILIAMQMIALSSVKPGQNQSLIENPSQSSLPPLSEDAQGKSPLLVPQLMVKDEEGVDQVQRAKKMLEDVRQSLENKEKENDANRARLGGLSDGDGQTMESWSPNEMKSVP